ncbi:hypothetical protein DL765_004853 [Monosporascus sp. GIB2]|nr:hypothetical protein DL765_004853 [Monosporascus sp. GIB2]
MEPPAVDLPDNDDPFSDEDFEERDAASWRGHYPLPNDDQEQSREELLHLLFVGVLNGKYYLAPIGSNPQKIIDLGTGTGSWAIEVAEKFPGAEVVGVDLSPIQPDWCPPNLRFHVDNIEDDWVYGSGFDYIHLRHMALTMKSPATLLTTAYDKTKSGGWIEFQDLLLNLSCDDDALPPDYVLPQIPQLTKESLKSLDFDVDFVDRLPLELERAGFINVRREVFKVPVGAWPRNEKMRYFGLMAREVLVELLRPLASKPFQSLGIPQSDLNAIVSEAEDAFDHIDHHIYVEFGIVYAQKP